MIFSRLFGAFSQDIGIDLGTANTLVYVKGKGIIINEPSIVAINKKTDQILAIGNDARKMVGKTPAHIVATKPLSDGVISDFEITEKMLRYFIEKVHREGFNLLPRPRVIIGVPLGITEVERKAVEDAAINAGARKTYLIEETMAASIGAKLPIQDSEGSMICDIGGGTTEIAVISLGGVVVSRSLRIAGTELDENVVDFARSEFNLLIGERTAEDIKIAIGSAIPLKEPLAYIMKGRDLVTGLPKKAKVTDEQVRKALSPSIKTLVSNVKATIEETPPELVADIMEKGIVLSGGGALLRLLNKLISKETGIPVHIADDPLTCVARGCGVVLEDLDALGEILLSPDKREVPV
ncbi:rod shape-determining protein [bacterium (Candidatus Torokbacteria) CG_4_10_14_0_2_um_filter_35_8]|nr:MAG: rod shape-determining protein [bacterium (Candidatus Torokbacteria) CG_4_10_14_0_2_um_filter_35_8]